MTTVKIAHVLNDIYDVLIVQTAIEDMLISLKPFIHVTEYQRVDHRLKRGGRRMTTDAWSILLEGVKHSPDPKRAFQEFGRVIQTNDKFHDIKDYFMNVCISNDIKLLVTSEPAFLTQQNVEGNKSDVVVKKIALDMLKEFKKQIVEMLRGDEDNENFKLQCFQLLESGYKFKFLLLSGHIFELLNSGSVNDLTLSKMKIALEHLLPYALNLCRYPDQQEFKIIKKYSAYFTCNILENLGAEFADTILATMGYHLGENEDELVLEIPSQRIMEVAFELFLCEQELKRMISVVDNANDKYGISASQALEYLLELSQKQKGTWKIYDINIHFHTIRDVISMQNERNPSSYQLPSNKFNVMGSTDISQFPVDERNVIGTQAYHEKVFVNPYFASGNPSMRQYVSKIPGGADQDWNQPMNGYSSGNKKMPHGNDYSREDSNENEAWMYDEGTYDNGSSNPKMQNKIGTTRFTWTPSLEPNGSAGSFHEVKKGTGAAQVGIGLSDVEHNCFEKIDDNGVYDTSNVTAANYDQQPRAQDAYSNHVYGEQLIICPPNDEYVKLSYERVHDAKEVADDDPVTTASKLTIGYSCQSGQGKAPGGTTLRLQSAYKVPGLGNTRLTSDRTNTWEGYQLSSEIISDEPRERIITGKGSSTYENYNQQSFSTSSSNSKQEPIRESSKSCDSYQYKNTRDYSRIPVTDLDQPLYDNPIKASEKKQEGVLLPKLYER